MMKKFTKITPLDKDKVGFNFSDELTASSADAPINISSVYKLAAERLIAVKGQVVQISGIKVINTTSKGKLQKQEIVIRDTTACMKVVLWEQYVNSVELNKTYQFIQLRVKGTHFERYLNTPKSEPFQATESPPFEHPLVEVDNDLQLANATSSTISAKILGFQKASKNLACASCHKKSILETRQASHSMPVMQPNPVLIRLPSTMVTTCTCA